MKTVWIVVVNNLFHVYQYTLSDDNGKWLTFATEEMAKSAQSQHPLSQLGWWSERKEIAVMPDDPNHVVVK